MRSNTQTVYSIQAQSKNDKEADWQNIRIGLSDFEVKDQIDMIRKNLKEYNIRIVKETISSEIVTMRDINKLFK